MFVNGGRPKTIPEKYPDVVPFFTKKDYKLYKKAKGDGTRYKPRLPDIERRLVLLYRPSGVPNHIVELLHIKKRNHNEHLNVWHHLVDKFDDEKSYLKKRQKMNSDPYLVFSKMVKRIKYRKPYKQICDLWCGVQGEQKLISYVQDIWDKQKGLCAISGKPMKLSVSIPKENLNDRLDRVSIDRIDSTEGYVPGNLQLVCFWVNIMKSDYGMEEFISNIKMISEYQNLLVDKLERS